jgi:hypothetical protein
LAPSAHLSRAAERLIAGHIDSVGALDLLLLVHHDRERDWSRRELCERLRCPEAWAVDQLERLARAGLVREVANGRYRYRRGAGSGSGSAVDEIARACRHDRAAVTRLIFAHPPSAR